MNSQIKTSCLWTYLISVCTTSNIGRMHGKSRTSFKSHNKSIFSQIGLLFGASVCIFTTSDLYSPTHISEGSALISNEFQIIWNNLKQIIFWNNFKPFVSSVFTRFTNSSTFFGLCEKKAYKDYNIPLMCITKNNLLKTKISKLVWCTTQFPLMINGAIYSFV